jgi:hypothetical protein
MITNLQIQTLVGKNIELLCFAQFSLYIHLSGGALLTVEAEFQHFNSETHRSESVIFPISHSSLFRILECSVVTAVIDSEANLFLTVSNGDRINVITRPEFESYHLKIGTEEFRA